MVNRKRSNTKFVAVEGAAFQTEEMRQEDLLIERLPRTRTYPSPVKHGKAEVEVVMFDPKPQEDLKSEFPVSMSQLLLQLASTRKELHFNPSQVTIGIVTCGGLCPGLNDVIRSLTLCAISSFSVKRVVGFRFGYWGLSAAGRGTAMELTHQSVAHQIHRQGGTILGSSRGPQKASEMVDTLVDLGVNVLFTVGGDGTQKGASVLYAEAKKRGLDISVFGIPKTIDNDLSFSHRTFGFETAVEQAVFAIRAAYSEASSARYGIGIVKLMGRHSGFIAAHASVASGTSHMCLIPEQPVSIDTIFNLLKCRFETSSYCVIVVAEGFGQDWVTDSGKKDASGNKVLTDIGVLLKDKINAFMKSSKDIYPEYTIKYIDPSYMIRACAPNSSDAAFCTNLSTFAVHEALAGHTNCIIAQRYSQFILVPIRAATSIQRRVDTTGNLWRQVRETTVHASVDAKEGLRRELTREMKCAAAKREDIIRQLAALSKL